MVQDGYLLSKERVDGRTHVRVISKETGEVEASYWENATSKPIGRPPNKSRGVDFFRVYRSNWLDIVRKAKLTVHEGGFLMFLMAFVKWESCFLVHPETGENLTVTSLSKLLGMDRSNVSDALTKLNNRGFLAIIKRGDGRENNFMINSNVLFFGKYVKDISEHHAFDEVEYQPVVRIKYKEPLPKEDA